MIPLKKDRPKNVSLRARNRGIGSGLSADDVSTTRSNRSNRDTSVDPLDDADWQAVDQPYRQYTSYRTVYGIV
jgi:hypothetical protein